MLDEPFSGLDPVAVDTVLNVLQRYAAAGVPVLFSSHQLDVVERLADDLVIIAGGKIRAAGQRLELQRRHSEGLVEIGTDGSLDWLRDLPGVEVVSSTGTEAVLRVADEATAQRVLRAAMERGSVTKFGPRIEKLSRIYKEVVA